HEARDLREHGTDDVREALRDARPELCKERADRFPHRHELVDERTRFAHQVVPCGGECAGDRCPECGEESADWRPYAAKPTGRSSEQIEDGLELLHRVVT